MTRRTVGLLTFVIGTTLCGLWGYLWLRTALSWMAQGSAGIGAVSAGLSELALAVLAVVAPFVITFRLTRLAGPNKLATRWRSAHVAAAVALVAVAIVGTIFLKMAVLSVFFPIQLFFANGALAIWIANPVRSA